MKSLNLSTIALVLFLATTSAFAETDTFSVGTSPEGLAFDGANIWVTNYGDNTVTKLRASDGAALGTFAAPSPQRVAFDGTNIWVTNNAGNSVTKLRASDGAFLGSFPVGNHPMFLAIAGNHVWVGNSDSNDVTKLRASDGAVLGTFPTGGRSFGVAFDGANIWVATQGGPLTKLRASDGAVLGTFFLPTFAYALAFDGANIWATSPDATVSKLRASDGAVLGTFPTGGHTLGIGATFDGTNIWVTVDLGPSPGSLIKLRVSDGAVLGTFPTGVEPFQVAFDGANMWVANGVSNTVSRFTKLAADLQGSVAIGAAPVVDTKVQLTSKSSGKVTTSTDATGSYQFDPAATGIYKVIIGTFVVGEPTTVSGHLIVKGVPSAGTKLKLRNKTTGDVLKTSTDASGNFSFASAAAGKYKMTISPVPVP